MNSQCSVYDLLGCDAMLCDRYHAQRESVPSIFHVEATLLTRSSALKMEAAHLSTKLHGATSHMAVILILPDMRTFCMLNVL